MSWKFFHPFSDSSLCYLLQQHVCSMLSTAASSASGAPQVLLDHGPYPDCWLAPRLPSVPSLLQQIRSWVWLWVALLSVRFSTPSTIRRAVSHSVGLPHTQNWFPSMGPNQKSGHRCCLETLLELDSFSVAVHQMEGPTLYWIIKTVSVSNSAQLLYWNNQTEELDLLRVQRIYRAWLSTALWLEQCISLIFLNFVSYQKQS